MLQRVSALNVGHLQGARKFLNMCSLCFTCMLGILHPTKIIVVSIKISIVV